MNSIAARLERYFIFFYVTDEKVTGRTMEGLFSFFFNKIDALALMILRGILGREWR